MFYGSAAASPEATPQLQGQLAQQATKFIEVHQFKGDSTRQQAVEKSKVHIVSSEIAIFSAEDLDLCGYMVNVEKLQSIANAMKTVEDLQQWLRALARSSVVFLIMKVMGSVWMPEHANPLVGGSRGNTPIAFGSNCSALALRRMPATSTQSSQGFWNGGAVRKCGARWTLCAASASFDCEKVF